MCHPLRVPNKDHDEVAKSMFKNSVPSKPDSVFVQINADKNRYISQIEDNDVLSMKFFGSVYKSESIAHRLYYRETKVSTKK